MTYREFYKAVHPFVVFSYEDIRGVFGSIDRRRLHEWAKKGYMTPLIKGHFVFSEYLGAEGVELLISNKIYEPSYISTEFVMSQHSLIPEAVYTVTAVSTRKTMRFSTAAGNYSYRTIKRELFTGYDMKKITVNFAGKQSYRFVRIASLEKAFFDFIYFGNMQLSVNQIADYRFDNEVLASMDIDRLYAFIQQAGRKSLESTLTNFLKYHDVV